MSLQNPGTTAFRLKNSPEHQMRFDELKSVAETYGVEPAVGDFNAWLLAIAKKGVGSSVSFYREPEKYKAITEQAYFGGAAPNIWGAIARSVQGEQPQELRRSAISPDAIAASRDGKLER